MMKTGQAHMPKGNHAQCFQAQKVVEAVLINNQRVRDLKPRRLGRRLIKQLWFS